MKTLNASQVLGVSGSRFESARALALSLAESDSELLEPELVAWIDRSTGKASPVLEGCAGPNGRRDYGVSHGGVLEVDVDGGTRSFCRIQPLRFLRALRPRAVHQSARCAGKRVHLPSRRQGLRPPGRVDQQAHLRRSHCGPSSAPETDVRQSAWPPPRRAVPRARNGTTAAATLR